MKTSNYVKKMNDYKKCMRMLDCAHCIFINEIECFEFKKVSKHVKAKNMYNKITSDFKTINEELTWGAMALPAINGGLFAGLGGIAFI